MAKGQSLCHIVNAMCGMVRHATCRPVRFCAVPNIPHWHRQNSFHLIRLLETQKGTHNGLDGVLTVPCLTEDDQSVGLKALVGNLKALGDDLAVQVILATVDFCCSLLFLID